MILPHTSSLSSSVQSVSIDVRTVKLNADLTVKTLEGCRNDESFDLIWLKTSEKCEQVKKLIEDEVDDDYIEFKEAKLPNRKPSRRRQNLLGESSDGNHEFSDIKTYHRITHFFPALDKVIFELRSRFAENENEVLCSLEEIICESNPDDKHFECVSEFYSLDIDLLKAQHQLLKHFKSQYVTSQVSVPEMFKLLIEKQTCHMIPELAKAIKIYSVIPATSCSSERSFSCLRRLKSYLRSTMKQDRLSSLALLNIEREFVNRVLKENMDDMFGTFGRRSGRSSQFF